MKVLNVVLIVLSLSGLSAYAVSNSEICSDSTGKVIVTDGNVTIEDGVGPVGPVTDEEVLYEISEKHESCVDGSSDYVSTWERVKKINYNIEEGQVETTNVICTETQTGIVPPGTVCP